MTTQRLLLFVLPLLLLPAPLAGQDPEKPSKSFDRKYIDASEYRADRVQLYDWPALTDLVVWSRRLEAAVAEVDQSLSADLLTQFKARVDSVRSRPLPAFLAGRADSVKSALAAIGAALDRAEGSLAAIPEAQVIPKAGAARVDSAQQRTIVTGNTAVRVPAGVAVGSERDSLPTVAFVAGEAMNFVDLVALALVELDRVVHLTRTAGAEARVAEANPTPAGREATPAPGTPPRRTRP